MKITKRELIQQDTKRKNYHFEIKERLFEDDPYLRALKEVSIDLAIRRDALDRLLAEVDIKGDMVCPCAITLEDVAVPFSMEEEIELSFTDQDDVYFVENDFDVEDFVLSIILPEVPIKVVKNEKIEYPRGDGWRVMTEETLKRESEDKVDPRWDKLKEYQFGEED